MGKQTSQESLRYDDVLAAIENTCDAKGWDYEIKSRDLKMFRYATICVTRDSVAGVFEFCVVPSIKVSWHKMSTYDQGLRELNDAFINELSCLKWFQTNDASGSMISDAKSSYQAIERFLRRFDVFARQLKKRYSNRASFNISDEYDVQDILHSMLRGFFEDVRAEEYTPSYAGGASRMDFLLKAEKMVIEIKMTNDNLKDVKVGEQLLIDIARYKSHPDCKKLLCFVYDPEGKLKNPAGLESDLSKSHDGLDVKLIIVPH